MAEEYDTRPILDITRIGERPREQQRHPSGAPPARRSVVDAASVMGIPAEHLTPSVQAAIVNLMAEVEHLRAALDRHQLHEDWLDDVAHHHTLAPVMNRRGLMRELAKLLAHMAQVDFPCSLVMIHVGGLERLRVQYGLAAGDAARRHLASAIVGAVRQTDVVAGLDGSDFAVILTLADHAAVEAKAEEIVASINHPPWQWEGRDYLFSIGIGIHDLVPDEQGDHALAAADLDRRRRGHAPGIMR